MNAPLASDEDFRVEGAELHFRGVNVAQLARRYGTPLKLSFLPRISQNVRRARTYFAEALQRHDYAGEYIYTYCTKSAHHRLVVAEAIAAGAHIEASSAYDLAIVERLADEGALSRTSFVVCNGPKTEDYLRRIFALRSAGFPNIVPVADSFEELVLVHQAGVPMQVGVRLANPAGDGFPFSRSRFGLTRDDIVRAQADGLFDGSPLSLTMLHFFVDSGIDDSPRYWNALQTTVDLYYALQQRCDALKILNIGGGLRFRDSVARIPDYQRTVDRIVAWIAEPAPDKSRVPDIMSEFGSFTVAESGAHLFSVVGTKTQAAGETWAIIDGSFATMVPDVASISRPYIVLPLNNLDTATKPHLLGGLSCDALDYYRPQGETPTVELPTGPQPQLLGVFHTGAYQDALSGLGGAHHCLIPEPRHVVVRALDSGELVDSLYADTQSPEHVLRILGYG